MSDFFDGWLGWMIIGLVEVVALAIAVALWWFGHLAWYLVPLSLIIPPVLAVVAGVLGLMGAEANGENPFQ